MASKSQFEGIGTLSIQGQPHNVHYEFMTGTPDAATLGGKPLGTNAFYNGRVESLSNETFALGRYRLTLDDGTEWHVENDGDTWSKLEDTEPASA